jgi:hypothetical protein
MSVIKTLFLAILCMSLLAVTGCQTEKKADYTVISRSEEPRPKWVGKSVYESKKYIYIIASTRSETNNSTTTLYKTKSELQNFLDAQGAMFLAPVIESLGKARYDTMRKEFSDSLYSGTKEHMQKKFHTYWEQIQFIENGQNTVMYMNYAVMRIDRDAYYANVRRFFKNQLRLVRLKDKTKTDAALEGVLRDVEVYIDKDKKRIKKMEEETILF